MSKCVGVGFLIVLLATSRAGAVLPADRSPSGNSSIPWQGLAGVPGGIPKRTQIFVNVATTTNPKYKCPPGGLDISGALQNAMADCPPGQVVYIPSGVYHLSNEVRLTSQSYWTLRGEGPGKTIIRSFGNRAFNLGNVPWITQWPPTTPVMSGASRGSSSITVQSSANLKVGQLMWIEQPNDGSNVFNYGIASGTPLGNTEDRKVDGTHVFSARALVTQIVGNTVNFNPPLAVDFGLAPQVTGFNGMQGPFMSGIEDITLIGAVTGQGISVTAGYGFWLKNIELTGWGSFGIWLNWGTTASEVRQCYIHEPNAYEHNRGYAMQLDNVNNCLIEDNIFYRCGTGIIMQGCSSGNVIAYNLFFQPLNHLATEAQVQSLYGNHTPFPVMNLWEGNYASGFLADFYYGPSALQTLFRNNLHCADPDTKERRIAVSFDSHQWSNSVIANILGSTGTNSPLYASLPGKTITWQNNSPLSWTYDPGTRIFPYTENVILRLGYPFGGNNTSSGADAFKTNLMNIDLLVRSNTLIHANFDYATKKVNYDPAIPDQTPPPSLYLASKPEWFSSAVWPPFDPNRPGEASITSIPAGVRFVRGTNLSNTVPPPSSLRVKK